MSKHILVTGGAGFIGSNFIHYFRKKYPDARLINLDALTYAGHAGHLEAFAGDPNYQFVHGDICDKSLVAALFSDYRIAGVVHFAAESHVDNSISNPDAFVKTNINGTFNLLEAARRSWMAAPFEAKEPFENARFLHISTDEVYGSLGPEGYFTEQSPYAPNSPYSASKASSDMLARSYFHTYGLNVVITNCSNNYGARQHDEKLIPTIIRKALRREPIPIYGDGQNIRDWLYVDDHCRGIDLAFHKGRAGESYNVGGRNEKTNIEVAEAICRLLDETHPQKGMSHKSLITFVKDRPGHDRRYAIDASKIEAELGWKPQEAFESGLRKTVEWYQKLYKAERL